MKKEINITLIALILIIANFIDAKTIREKQSMSKASFIIKETTQNALDGTAPVTNIINVIQQEAQTNAEQETAPLLAEEEILKKEQELIKQEIKNLNYGFFGFGTSKETQEKYKDAIERLNENQTKLKKITMDLNANKKETGISWYNTVKYGVTAAIILGISAAAIYNRHYSKNNTKITSMPESQQPTTREITQKKLTAAKKRHRQTTQKTLERINQPGYQSGR